MYFLILRNISKRPFSFFLIFPTETISRTDEGQPDRNIFSINVELTSTFFSLQRFGPSPSPNFKAFLAKIKIYHLKWPFVIKKMLVRVFFFFSKYVDMGNKRFVFPNHIQRKISFYRHI